MSETTFRRYLKILPPDQITTLKPELQSVVEYRKSGLSLNHVVGCPLDCAYCVRHLFDNFELKTPRALMSDEDAVAELLNHKYFKRDVTPIQVFNRATDPMLPVVKGHTFRVLALLDGQGLRNNVLIITRWRVEDTDCDFLNSLKNIRVTVLVTHSGIQDSRIEPVDSKIAITTLKTLYAHARSYRVIQYWRPIVPGLNDSEAHLEQAYQLSRHAHATVFTGLFYRNQIAEYYRDNGIPAPYEEVARRKILPEVQEERILDYFRKRGGPIHSQAVFRKTSCAVSFAHSLPDYNGHYGIRELCDICPVDQLRICADAWKRPDPNSVEPVARSLGAVGEVTVGDRAIEVDGLSEEKRYYIQHGFQYQVHDRQKAHHYRRHGRADIGWETATRTEN